jgi:hypothetical protein
MTAAAIATTATVEAARTIRPSCLTVLPTKLLAAEVDIRPGRFRDLSASIQRLRSRVING